MRALRRQLEDAHDPRRGARVRGESRGDDRRRVLPGASSSSLRPSPPSRPRGIRWAAGRSPGQNLLPRHAGAFTGEVSAAMLADAGCRYVIVGHSERRSGFRRGRDDARQKARARREAGLHADLLRRRDGEERAAGRTAAILERQVGRSRRIRPAPPGDRVRARLGDRERPRRDSRGRRGRARACWRELLAARPDLRILYGGSVTPENAAGTAPAGRAWTAFWSAERA